MDELFFAADLSGVSATLDVDESRHCLRVKRHRPGDTIHVFDGKGMIASARITGAESVCRLEILERHQQSAWPSTTIATTVPKNPSRIEWFAEKATELGLSRIILMRCARSERESVRLERLQRIVLEAAKQALNPWLPAIEEMDFPVVVDYGADQRFIAVQGANKTLHSACTNGRDVIVLIGPEGDFTDQEKELAKKMGFIDVNLGNNRLRTETAALVACHTITLMHG